MSRWPIPPDTQIRQEKASNPARSAWVSAHAGSGKTYVLSQRVVRLLLEGAPPSKILCLTFTKVAAANMALKVFSILSEWTRMSDAELRAAIVAMGADPARIDLARKLFARTVETPGGLKIQTIHAFCERLLHLFPFEANVAARFEVLTDDKQAELVSIAREQTLADAMEAEASPLGQALRHVAALTTSFTFDKLLSQALRMRTEIAQAGRRQAGGYARALRRRFGAPADADVATIERDMIEGGIAPAEWGAIVGGLEAGSANDKKAAARLRRAISAGPGAKLSAWTDVFFTAGKPRANVATNSVDKALKERLHAERDRLFALSDAHKAAVAAQRSESLATLTEAIIARYTSLKRTRGLLDFDDLVERTGALLKRSDAAWVLYKLDAGIDHVLVDEAQDTSPAQWDILERLTGEFFAGEGARKPRTFFAVGDEKQSIFSFQGAAPHAFAEKRRQFENRAHAAERAFEHVRLQLSFRSAKGVLDEVDNVFAANEAFKGVVGPDDVWMPHEALKRDLPGLVEIWEPLGATGKQEPTDWKMPLDQLGDGDPAVVLARRIADAIFEMTATGSRHAVHDKQGALRPVSAGDVLILVRKRGAFFEAVIRALKDRGVPVAGADRLELAQHIAVLDLVAAGRAALLPQDDLTLACVLKSPLIGLDEDDLLALAPGRKGPLITELRASGDPRHRAAAQRVAEWGARAGESPFRFYARILGPDGGRRAFLERLGAEAGDAVDEFLKLALEAEMLEAPSLVTFLHRMQSAELSIKRDMEAAGDAVRVMTVHAAKGLEAKIVFLPDTCGAASGGHDPDLLKVEDLDGAPLIAWRKGAKADPAALAEQLTAAQAREAEEHRRLLYVAMTRAEERLYICGFHGVRGPGKGCWHVLAASALGERLTQAPAPWDDAETVRRTGAAAMLPAPA
ncbi:MAG: double-strand break repair helicase AddA, partial [Hyphomicrobiales bacterium]|nr:double-strand break repair helicase AddA [Hyphomicrobiales bacterium]